MHQKKETNRSNVHPTRQERLARLLFGAPASPGITLDPIKWPEALGE